ncbi:MAG: putative nucleic acid-binding protein [Natronomonas sp.]
MSVSESHKPDPTHVVVDADVLASDLLVGGPARDVMDIIRSHSWLKLIVTEPLLEETQAIVESLADQSLADDWRAAIDELAVVVEQPPEDRPVLAAAYRGDASQIVTFDDRLRSAEAGATLRGLFEVSVRSPNAFLAVVDPTTLYELAFEGSYPGPDRKPR